jgi:PhoPQ-activated pathogenicity-related protein
MRAADTQRPAERPTALDRYVARPDPAFRWEKVAEQREDGVTCHILNLVSQRWESPVPTNRPEWQHWLTIFQPEQVGHRTALLFISGGSNRPGQPPKPSREFLEIAKATRSVVAEIRNVPNQPLAFTSDNRDRKEDDFIAFTWAQYMRSGDERWPARLPMTKAAVRAMDAVTACLAGLGERAIPIENFVVGGASKRGWTAWTTAIVDRRVVAICPLVIDVLNVERSMSHHYQAYGFFAPAVGDYTAHHIMHWAGTPEAGALYAIEDPYFYRDRLAMPKLLINACGDQFFLPDSSRFYFADLPGPKYLRYIPNTDHSLKDSDAVRTVAAWHHAILQRTPLPRLTWQRKADGSLVVEASPAPREAKLWQATNPAARDFRLETIGPAWTSQPLPGQAGRYEAKVAPPAAGWTAFMVEMTFALGGPAPLKLTTEVIVTPDRLPFPPADLPQPKGFLSN